MGSVYKRVFSGVKKVFLEAIPESMYKKIPLDSGIFEWNTVYPRIVADGEGCLDTQ